MLLSFPIESIWCHSGFLRVNTYPFIRYSTYLISYFLFAVDVDILKPDTGYLSVIERPSGFSSNPSSRSTATPAKSPPTTGTESDSGGSSSPVVLAASYTEPLSEGEDDDDEGFGPAKDEGKRTGLSGAEVKAAIEYREKMLKERREVEEETRKNKDAGKVKDSGDAGTEEPSTGEIASANGEQANSRRPKIHREESTLSKKLKTRTLSIDPLAPSTAFDETLKTKLRGAQEQEQRRLMRKHKNQSSSRPSTRAHSRTQSRSQSVTAPRKRDDRVNSGSGEDRDDRTADEVEEENALGGLRRRDAEDRIVERSWRAPQGKRISVPVRVEPKVYFAAERTFLVRILTTPSTPFLDLIPHSFL